MKKVLNVAAAALIAGTAFTGSAIAQNRGDRADRTAPTANQIVAQEDARASHQGRFAPHSRAREELAWS